MTEKPTTFVQKLMLLVITLAALYGYIANLMKLIGSDFDPLTGLVVARVVGVFVGPVGAVLGFF